MSVASLVDAFSRVPITVPYPLFPAPTEFPAACGSAGSSASADVRGNIRARAVVFCSRSGPSMGCRKKCRKLRAPRIAPARRRVADRPASTRRRCAAGVPAPALGLTQIQSRPAGAAIVPLVSTAISKPRACSASMSGSVDLQQRLAAGADDEALAGLAHRPASFAQLAAAKASAEANLPPPRPSMSAKSVSQNLQMADARSASRPDHRLQPAKRQKTAGARSARPRLAACRRFL